MFALVPFDYYYYEVFLIIIVNSLWSFHTNAFHINSLYRNTTGTNNK